MKNQIIVKAKAKKIITIDRQDYLLLLSHNPCDVFTYFNVNEMHGLSLKECQAYNNTIVDSYIAGWSNFTPRMGLRFVFINLSRCVSDIETFGLIIHELMHQSFYMHLEEEEIITWAELEAYEVFEIVKTKI
jgi:hypothetical protein